MSSTARARAVDTCEVSLQLSMLVLPRRVFLAAVPAISLMSDTGSLESPVPAVSLESLRDTADRELQLEAQLLETLSSERRESATIRRLISELEISRGRQQRAGWGQSDSRWDLPYIGAWDILYDNNERPPENLVSARQWIYGPGEGGFAAECTFANDPHSRMPTVLITRLGAVVKLQGPDLRLDLDGVARAYQLAYSSRQTALRQKADGRWESVEIESSTSMPVVGDALPSQSSPRLCTSAAGLQRTTYLSDTVWIVRSARTGGDQEPTVLLRTQAEALRPQNGGDGPDGFDAKRFGPSGRKIWMMDTGINERELNYARGRQRMRADDEVSGS